MSRFWDAFESSSVMQGIIASALTGGVVYLCVIQAQIPDVLANGFLLMLGYFFGAKGMAEARSLARKLSS